ALGGNGDRTLFLGRKDCQGCKGEERNKIDNQIRASYFKDLLQLLGLALLPYVDGLTKSSKRSLIHKALRISAIKSVDAQSCLSALLPALHR
ncbi:hypothetical protein, partial [Segatella copri]|uniref:hypothetical protein n=1 Tax=Segatella copri TaxID=165179 RepID=UPI001C92155D